MNGFSFRTMLSALFLLLCARSAAALAQEDGSGAQLNINPMRLEESAPAPAAPLLKQKEKTVGKLDDLNIEGAPEEDEMWWMNDVLAKLSPAIQNDLAARSGEAQRFCEENFMLNNFYDCECYGIAVLKDLVLKGGESESIAPNVQDERFNGCVDTGKIAGFSYGRCRESLVLVQITDEALEETCQCAARAMAREYKRNPIANMDRADRTYNGLVMDCRQRAGAGGGGATGGIP